jgi:hypothetical protein
MSREEKKLAAYISRIEQMENPAVAQNPPAPVDVEAEQRRERERQERERERAEKNEKERLRRKAEKEKAAAQAAAAALVALAPTVSASSTNSPGTPTAGAASTLNAPTASSSANPTAAQGTVNNSSPLGASNMPTPNTGLLEGLDALATPKPGRQRNFSSSARASGARSRRAAPAKPRGTREAPGCLLLEEGSMLLGVPLCAFTHNQPPLERTAAESPIVAQSATVKTALASVGRALMPEVLPPSYLMLNSLFSLFWIADCTCAHISKTAAKKDGLLPAWQEFVRPPPLGSDMMGQQIFPRISLVKLCSTQPPIQSFKVRSFFFFNVMLLVLFVFLLI